MNTPFSTRTRLRQSQFSRAVQYSPSRAEQWAEIITGTIRHPVAVARVLWAWAVWRWKEFEARHPVLAWLVYLAIVAAEINFIIILAMHRGTM
jgi:hypothetical protein